MWLTITVELLFFVIELGVIAWALHALWRHGAFSRRGQFAALLLAAIFPIVLLIDPRGGIYRDYFEHAWLIALVAQDIRDGHWLPNVVHSAALIGDPIVSMSGRFYYLVAAYLALPFGVQIAVRVLAYGVALLQIALMLAAASAYSRDRLYAYAVACLTAWSSYAMNNLFVRGALPEFMATMLLGCAASCLLLFFRCDDRRLLYALGGSLCFAAAALTHSITAVYGALLLALLAVALAIARRLRPRDALYGAAAACMIGVMLAPWLYVVLALDPVDSAIGSTFELLRFGGVDEAWLRLLPLPYSAIDPSLKYYYYVTPINSVLLVLGGALLVARGAASRRALAAALLLLAAAALVFVVSVSSVLDALLPLPLRAAQFAYRLVTYVNLLLFAGAVLAGLGLYWSGLDRRWRVACCAALALGAFGVLLNLVFMRKVVPFHYVRMAEHEALRPLPSSKAVRSLRSIAGCSYGRGRAADDRCPTSTVTLPLRVEASGAVSAAIEPSAAGRTQITNVLNFPWNRMRVDGRDAVIAPSGLLYAVELPAGARTIRYVFDPGRTYLLLDRMSLATMALVFVAVVILARRRERGAIAPPSS